jgi:hypothetical protein
MQEMARVKPGMLRARPVRQARATAAVLPRTAFAPADSVPSRLTPRPVIDRLAWPAAAAAILAACIGLWLGIGSLVRLLLG